MKKILLITQYFFPDKTGTGKILSDIFFGISNKFNIEVLAGGQIYNDRKTNLKKNEKSNGVNIRRISTTTLNKNKYYGRLYNYISFFIRVTFLLLKNNTLNGKDIILTSSNPPIIPLLPIIFKNKTSKTVYILHDLYPDIAEKLNIVSKKNILSIVMRCINREIFRKTDYIVVLGRDVKEYLENNYNVNEKKIHVITNFYKEVKEKKSNHENKKIRIIYAGNIGQFHQFDEIIASVKKTNNYELFFIGNGAQKERLQKMSIGTDNIYFRSFLDDKKYDEMMRSADFLLVSLKQGLAGLAVPSKFYSYLAYGKAIICISDTNTEMARVIDAYKCGIVSRPNDEDSLMEKLNHISENRKEIEIMGDKSKEIFIKYYKKENVILQWIEFLQKI